MIIGNKSNNRKQSNWFVTTVIWVMTNLFIGNSYAGIEKLVNSIMPVGTMSNISRPALIKDQLGGHLIGGSMVMKTPMQNDLSIASFTPPTCKMGGLPCNAHFDLRMGAFSYISAKEMMSSMKNMAQNAGAYVAVMAIKTICPQCEDLMTWLEGVQRDINDKLNTNCERMMTPITGTIDKIAKSAEANRQSNLVITGGGRDSAEIVQKAKKDTDSDPVDSNGELKNQLGENFNLVWKALERKADKTDSKGLKELLMSISGTIVIQKGSSPRVYSSLVNEELIEQYMGIGEKVGSQIKLYNCDENKKCLGPVAILSNLDRNNTLYGQIEQLLNSMVQKIKLNKVGTAFTEEEENLIALTTLPLIGKIEMDLAEYADSTNISVRSNEFITHLCYDVVTKYLSRLLYKVTEAVDELSYVQITDTGVFKKFSESTGNILSSLAKAKSAAFKRYDLINQMKGRLRQDESYFEMKFEEFVSDNNLE